jgi:hypothetical protein
MKHGNNIPKQQHQSFDFDTLLPFRANSHECVRAARSVGGGGLIGSRGLHTLFHVLQRRVSDCLRLAMNRICSFFDEQHGDFGLVLRSIAASTASSAAGGPRPNNG